MQPQMPLPRQPPRLLLLPQPQPRRLRALLLRFAS
jgi:hypothetical protein